MEKEKWETVMENFLEHLYGPDPAQQDAIIDNLFSHDVKLEQAIFTVQGKSSVKHVFHLYRALNRGQSRIDNIHLDMDNRMALVTFTQQVQPRLLPVPSIQFPRLTSIYFDEVTKDSFLVNRIHDHFDPQAIISSLPFVGGLFDSIVRPVAGAALVSLGSFLDRPAIQDATNRAEKLLNNGEGAIKAQTDQIFQTTERYREALERNSNQAIKAASDIGNATAETIRKALPSSTGPIANGSSNGTTVTNGTNGNVHDS